MVAAGHEARVACVFFHRFDDDVRVRLETFIEPARDLVEGASV
jgi:hypothetical protein